LDKSINSKICKNKADSECHNYAMLNSLLHELRVLNGSIKRSSELVSISSEKGMDIQNLEHHAKKIFNTTTIMSMWLDIADLEYNPENFTQQEKSYFSVHGIFHKAIIALTNKAKDKRIKIKKINSSNKSVQQIKGYPVVDLLPYLILDNSIKYSPNNLEIETVIVEDINTIKVTVSSFGPLLHDYEVEKVFINKYRGEEVEKLNIQGSGRGLCFAKFICDINEFEIMVVSSGGTININETTYRPFEITVIFKKP